METCVRGRIREETESPGQWRWYGQGGSHCTFYHVCLAPRVTGLDRRLNLQRERKNRLFLINVLVILVLILLPF